MGETMRPTIAFDNNIFYINALLHPGTIFNYPRDVVAHPSLSASEKRAILASWASDASAIASCLSLRAPASLRVPVTIDELLEVLCELDGGPRHPPGGKPNRLHSTSPWRFSANSGELATRSPISPGSKARGDAIYGRELTTS
jgi:hypothetical protein